MQAMHSKGAQIKLTKEGSNDSDENINVSDMCKSKTGRTMR